MALRPCMGTCAEVTVQGRECCCARGTDCIFITYCCGRGVSAGMQTQVGEIMGTRKKPLGMSSKKNGRWGMLEQSGAGCWGEGSQEALVWPCRVCELWDTNGKGVGCQHCSRGWVHAAHGASSAVHIGSAGRERTNGPSDQGERKGRILGVNNGPVTCESPRADFYHIPLHTRHISNAR